MLFNSSREFSYPQFSLSAISLSEFGKSHFGSLRSTQTPFSCKTIPRPPMVNGSTLFSIGDFPYREIRGCGVVRLLQHKTPTARHLSSTRSGGPTQLRHLSTRVIGDRGIAISPGLSPCLQEHRTPNSNPQGSYTTCPCSNQRLSLNREIATRDSNEHETLASSNAEARYADI
jgi:hypothetical protein